MKKHSKLFKTNKNMRDYKFFIYSELSKECFGLYKTYLRCADSYVGIMFCLKSAAALSVMIMLGITSIPTSDDETHRLIQKFKADYPEAYKENQDIINAYYAIRDIVNSYINDSRNVDYEQSFSNALEIYTKFFGTTLSSLTTLPIFPSIRRISTTIVRALTVYHSPNYAKPKKSMNSHLSPLHFKTAFVRL